MSGFLAELLEKELQKELQKQLPIEVEKEVQKEVQKKLEEEVQKKLQEEVQKKLQEEVQKELQADRNKIAISKICKMIELGYSKEEVLNLDYTNSEYALALEKISTMNNNLIHPFSQSTENRKSRYVPAAASERAQDATEHSERSDY